MLLKGAAPLGEKGLSWFNLRQLIIKTLQNIFFNTIKKAVLFYGNKKMPKTELLF
jgi:hypothetical protein